MALLAGCESGTSAAPARPAHSVGMDQAFPEIEAASGFSVGKADARRVAYVFFDPQCPHCATLWQSAWPVAESGDARFIWIPVGMLSRASEPQGATILGAADPIVAMHENEKLIHAGRGGISADSAAHSKFGAKVQANTELFNAFRAKQDGVPLLVSKVNGVLRKQSGSMPSAMLRGFLSL